MCPVHVQLFITAALSQKQVYESGRGLFLKCFQNSAWGRLLFGVYYLSQISCLNKTTLNDKNKSILNHEIYKKTEDLDIYKYIDRYIDMDIMV